MVSKCTNRGISLVEALIVAAIFSLFFGGLFLTIQNSLQLIADSRARMSALSVANDHVEYIRSLSYNAVGTVSGIPSGPIPQISTSTLNGILFTRRTLIEYIDAVGDGVGAADSNSITTDYKQAKVEVSWSQYGRSQSLSLITNVIPRGIETNVGGGTVRVNVFDADVQPMPGALVRLVNTTGTTSIDVTRTTDATGAALFGGAPAQAGYEVFVTRPGFSSDQTRVATGTLAFPSTLPAAVTAADTTTLNFTIDRLSTTTLRILTDRTSANVNNTFATTSDIATTSTNVVVNADAVRLTETGGVYAPAGNAVLPIFAPTPLGQYDALVVTGPVPANTTRRVVFYNGTNTSRIPDSDLPGNSIGFTESVISLRGLSSALYPTLRVEITLETTNSAVTPAVEEVVLHYFESVTSAPTSVTMRGTKTIGAAADLTPIYKHTYSGTTNGSGVLTFSGVEFDTYLLTMSGLDLAEVCPLEPFVISPGSMARYDILTTPNSAHTLRVAVQTAGGQPVRGATVGLAGVSSGSSETSTCGQVFFPGLVTDGGYTLTVTAPGYPAQVVDPLSIVGDTIQVVTLP